jgi:hypothetical protein
MIGFGNKVNGKGNEREERENLHGLYSLFPFSFLPTTLSLPIPKEPAHMPTPSSPKIGKPKRTPLVSPYCLPLIHNYQNERSQGSSNFHII